MAAKFDENSFLLSNSAQTSFCIVKLKHPTEVKGFNEMANFFEYECSLQSTCGPWQLVSSHIMQLFFITVAYMFS